ncbi:hypothetical protein I8751_00155 [Nostocaceae cyanobacterium CENA357]|uniref:Uncharacterized protein n=1 Tax=Atlanticothrix silvestris CENA357 TaxID=1725252 RepID=A0A8J7H6P1_9CYAN|nr:hypothetical protein [Atlanticothrix silvestris]MBH8550828.1 hypothetical protein [Atlanticothrix silvestris CENA357]
MIYGNMPMMIFILAAGYLFAVYLLLALAKRTGRKSAPRSFPTTTKGNDSQNVTVTSQVTEVVNSQ